MLFQSQLELATNILNEQLNKNIDILDTIKKILNTYFSLPSSSLVEAGLPVELPVNITPLA